MAIIGGIISLVVYLILALIFNKGDSSKKTPPHFVRKNIKRNMWK